MIDPARPFRVVYAISEHEFLGPLISTHVVQILEGSGELGMSHQILVPQTAPQFDHGLTPQDRALLALTADILPEAIVKRFGGQANRAADFFVYKYKQQDAVRKLVDAHVTRTLGRIMPLLQGHHVAEMAPDGYPAAKAVEMLPDKATVLFHFKRDAHETRYYPTIRLQDQPLEFAFRQARMVSNAPAWMLLEGRLFGFEQDVEGRRIAAFFNKYYIAVPRAMEAEYYPKFVTQTLERFPVRAEGFEIHTLQEQPRFRLRVKRDDDKTLSLIREVQYGPHTLPLGEHSKPRTVLFQPREGDFRFLLIERDPAAEQATRAALAAITPNPLSFTHWELMPREEALKWLATHATTLAAQGVEVLQPQDSPAQIRFEVPTLHMNPVPDGDWFDLQAVVRVAQFEIPFVKFRSHILRGKREYALPNEHVIILPEAWFADFRHLLEVAQHDKERIRIRPYQRLLLNPAYFASPQAPPQAPEPAPLPQGLAATLRHYQQHGFEWLVGLQEQGYGGILADDMGLGKTLQTIALLLHTHSPARPTASLVVLPTSLIYNWRSEAARFAPALRLGTHTGTQRARTPDEFAPYDVILTTYGTLRQDAEMLRTYPFQYIILDESQNIKNPASQTAQALKTLRARHRLALTGTPVENSVLDLWSQMDFLNPGLLGTEAFFKKFYALPIEKDKDPRRAERLRQCIYPFILRRTKQQVATELPPKVETIHRCDMTPPQQALYDHTRNAYRHYLLGLIEGGTLRQNHLNVLTGLQRLRQIAIHPGLVEAPEGIPGIDPTQPPTSGKYHELLRLLDYVVAQGAKVLIFSQFVKMLQLIRTDLQTRNLPHCYLDGATRDRQAEVERFQTDPQTQIFLISLKAGGTGLNLTAAEYVFLVDPWWNPAAEQQAIDRAHRMGQTRTVFYYKFITQDTIEDKILAMQQHKTRISDDLISVDEDMLKSLSIEDWRSLV